MKTLGLLWHKFIVWYVRRHGGVIFNRPKHWRPDPARTYLVALTEAEFLERQMASKPREVSVEDLVQLIKDNPGMVMRAVGRVEEGLIRERLATPRVVACGKTGAAIPVSDWNTLCRCCGRLFISNTSFGFDPVCPNCVPKK